MEGHYMKYFFTGLGVIAATILLLASAAMNWQFGYSLGQTSLDANIYGAASAAADGMKALLPFFTLWAFRNKNWSQVLAGLLLLAVCAGYSITSSLGFSALNRADTISQRTVQAAEYKDLRGELARVKERLSWIPKHRSTGEIEAEIAAAMLQPVKIKGRTRGTVDSLTKGCTSTSWYTREFCPKVFELRKEMAVSREADKLDTQISAIRNKLSGIAEMDAVTEANPQAAILTKITGLEKSDIELVLVVMVSILVEMGSGLGFFIALGHMRNAVSISPQQAQAGNGDNGAGAKRPAPNREIKRFFDKRIEYAEGKSVTASSLYEDYCQWCRTTGRQSMTLPAFGRQFGEIGVQKVKIAGRIHYIGISTKEKEPLVSVQKLTLADVAKASAEGDIAA
jgi:hypothetical protein